MSTHSISASGQRGISIYTNDPASSSVTAQAKAGDSAIFSANSFETIKLIVPASAKIRRFQVPQRDAEGYDEVIELEVGTTITARLEIGDREDSHPPTPHTSLYVKRKLDEQYWEQRARDGGRVVEAGTLGELLA